MTIRPARSPGPKSRASWRGPSSTCLRAGATGSPRSTRLTNQRSMRPRRTALTQPRPRPRNVALLKGTRARELGPRNLEEATTGAHRAAAGGRAGPASVALRRGLLGVPAVVGPGLRRPDVAVLRNHHARADAWPKRSAFPARNDHLDVFPGVGVGVYVDARLGRARHWCVLPLPAPARSRYLRGLRVQRA